MPPGVATQNNVLRSEYFIGLPEMVINFFRFVAEEVRMLMAELGVRKFEELIGRSDLLHLKEGESVRQSRLDLSPIVSTEGLAKDAPQFCTDLRNDPFDKGELAEQMVEETLPAIESKSGGRFGFEVQNFNRSIGARLAGEIARRYGNDGMADAPLEIVLRGTAGQSFGAWNLSGLNLTLSGDANDYVGKGMAGGRIVVRPPEEAGYIARDTAIIGNTCLYGATGGELYAAGLAGERFGVRNSGATAVIEGAGDHCCEYMTGGVVVVLGKSGLNFGAGMTGGFAYVLDIDRDFVDRYNHELIDIHRITAREHGSASASSAKLVALPMSSTRAACGVRPSLRITGPTCRSSGVVKPKGGGTRLVDRVTEAGSVMAKYPLQFLEVPRTDPDKRRCRRARTTFW